MSKKNMPKESLSEQQMPLSIKNYKLLAIGFAVIVLGFVLMAGGRGTTAEFFDYSMFSFRRITLAPIVVVVGFIIEVYAILKR